MGNTAQCCSGSGDIVDTAAKVDAVPSDGRAIIRVVGAKDVRPKNWRPSGTNECWCVVSLAGEEVFRTKAVTNMLDPVWREQHEITGFYSNQQLEFSIHDSDSCLGQTTLAWCRGLNGHVYLHDSEAQAMLRLKVRHPMDMDFPMGPPIEFKFRAQRGSKDVKWGMRLDTQNANRLLVDRVEATGPISTSNSNVLPEHQIKKNDVIVAVNDATGTTKEMMMEFVDKTDVTMTVRRTVEVSVDLERASVNTSLGMAFPPTPKGTSLIVTKLVSGLVHDYNNGQRDASMQIQVGDRVLAINGEGGDSEGFGDSEI